MVPAFHTFTLISQRLPIIIVPAGDFLIAFRSLETTMEGAELLTDGVLVLEGWAIHDGVLATLTFYLQPGVDEFIIMSVDDLWNVFLISVVIRILEIEHLKFLFFNFWIDVGVIILFS